MADLMQLVARAGNNALEQNPTVADIDITVRGSDWLWAVFSIMGLSFLGVSFYTFLRIPRGERAIAYCASIVLATASIAYFSLASDLGATPITVEFLHGSWAQSGTGINGMPTRSIWYVRYIDWTITTPFLLLTLLLVTPIPLSNVVFCIFADLVMIITGLVGSLVHSEYKWGYFVFGCVAMFYVYWILFGPGLEAAKQAGGQVHKAYVSGTFMLTFLWLLYPIAWGLADGGNVIHPDSEQVFYGILDVLAKPVFTVYHLWALRNVDYNLYGLSSGKASLYTGAPHQTGTDGPSGLSRNPVRKNVDARQSEDVSANTHNV